jgi:hypothetical protein
MKFDSSATVERKHSWATALPPDIHLRRKAKAWCDNYGSIGRYYYHYTNTRWWFEKESDAVWFSLHWSGKK